MGRAGDKAQWYHDCLAGMMSWVVESLSLKIIVTTIITDRAGSEESKWLPQPSHRMIHLRSPYITDTLDAPVYRR